MIAFIKWLNEPNRIKNWFSWLAWVSLSALFIAAGHKAGYWPVTFLGIFSAFLCWVSSVHSLSNLVGDFITKRLPKWLGWPIAGIVVAIMPLGILILLSMSLVALISSA
ncbi:hypothetical protein [Endozoicomonas sp. ALC020]|uniref:hypothetical protein n=1 Tax=unclassified Endozoicomonas TaxID=2644528 RepID=UPI003BB1E69B